MKKHVIPQQDVIPYLKTLLFIASADDSLTEELAYFSDESKDVATRNEEYAKQLYHSDGINKKWATIDKDFENDEILALSNARENLVV